MIHITRRSTLRGLGASGVVALSGCLAENDDSDSGTDDGNGDDGENGNGEDGDDGTGDGTDPPIEVHHVETPRTGSMWDYRDRPGFCTFLHDPGDATWLFDENDTETLAFVDATDFESSVLLYVESVGPNTCYNRLEVTDVAVEGGTIVGSATAIDASDEGDDVCAPSLTYPGALIRITTDPLPDAARITVTDGWGDSAEVTPEDGVVDPDSLPGFIRPDGDPEAVPTTLDCRDEDFERHYAGYGDDVSWGSGAGIDGTPGLELRVVDPDADGGGSTGSTTFARGDELRVELTNVSTARLGIGNRGKYNIELYTEDGWMDVRGGDGPFVYTDEMRMIPPGEVVSWAFTMTEEGLVEGHQHVDRLRVCPDLQSGRCRFVFWGGDDVAVAFDYDG